MKNLPKGIVPLAAILSLTILFSIALATGTDGLLLAGGAVLIAGIGGYIAPHRKKPQ